MIKYFYKKPRAIPTFFDKKLNVRFTAFGEEVKSDFLSWRNGFYKSWNDKFDNMLICEQGDIGGNAVRADGIYAYIGNLNATDYSSESVLPPLWWGDKIYEVTRDGTVKINKIKSVFNVGSELKAWALVTVKDERLHKGCLAVIGKPLGSSKMTLTVYNLAATDMESSIVAQVDMPVTLNDKSFLACYGRHIFAVHESTLHYFYLNKKFELERCAIGEDKESNECDWCKGVLPRVVCDGNANIFWATNDCVCGFTIGAPRNFSFKYDCRVGYKIANVACFDKTLYLYLADKRNDSVTCYVLRGKNGRYDESALLNDDATYNLITGQSDNYIRYVKIMRNGTALMAEYSFADKKEKIEVKLTGTKGNAFCCFGELAPARYVGYDKRKPVAIV